MEGVLVRMGAPVGQRPGPRAQTSGSLPGLGTTFYPPPLARSDFRTSAWKEADIVQTTRTDQVPDPMGL